MYIKNTDSDGLVPAPHLTYTPELIVPTPLSYEYAGLLTACIILLNSLVNMFSVLVVCLV